MKHIFCIWLTVAAAVTAFATDSPEDAKAVQGNWKPVKAELAGQPMADAVLKSISLKLDHGKYEVLVESILTNGIRIELHRRCPSAGMVRPRCHLTSISFSSKLTVSSFTTFGPSGCSTSLRSWRTCFDTLNVRAVATTSTAS